MFPAFAIIFLANKLVPLDLDGRVDLVNQIFFLSWLALTILGSFWNNYGKQNRNYLLIGGLLALAVPVANGVVTGDWFWQVLLTYPKVAGVDIFWCTAGITSIYLVFRVLKVSDQSNTPVKKDEMLIPPSEIQPEKTFVKRKLTKREMEPELAIISSQDPKK